MDPSWVAAGLTGPLPMEGDGRPTATASCSSPPWP